MTAERAFLAELGGGCTLPVGAHAAGPGPGPDLRLTGMMASADGVVVVRHTAGSGPTPRAWAGRWPGTCWTRPGVGDLGGWLPSAPGTSGAVGPVVAW